MSISRGSPIACWFVSWKKNNLKWMLSNYPHDLGNLHISMAYTVVTKQLRSKQMLSQDRGDCQCQLWTGCHSDSRHGRRHQTHQHMGWQWEIHEETLAFTIWDNYWTSSRNRVIFCSKPCLITISGTGQVARRLKVAHHSFVALGFSAGLQPKVPPVPP